MICFKENEFTGVMAPKAIDVIHPRIIHFNSGKLSSRILKTNGRRQHFLPPLISASASSNSSKLGPSDVVDFTETYDFGRRFVKSSKIK